MWLHESEKTRSKREKNTQREVEKSIFLCNFPLLSLSLAYECVCVKSVRTFSSFLHSFPRSSGVSSFLCCSLSGHKKDG